MSRCTLDVSGQLCQTRTNLEGRNELAQCYDEKVEVEEELELFPKDDWQERHNAVLLISNDIRGILRTGTCCQREDKEHRPSDGIGISLGPATLVCDLPGRLDLRT